MLNKHEAFREDDESLALEPDPLYSFKKALHCLHHDLFDIHDYGWIPWEWLDNAFFELDPTGTGIVDLVTLSDTLQSCGGVKVLDQIGWQVRHAFLEIDMNSSDDMDIHEFIQFFRLLEDLHRYHNKPGASYVFVTRSWGGPRKDRVQLDKEIRECTWMADQYDISVTDNDSGGTLGDVTLMKANGNYTLARKEGNVTIAVIWNGSKRNDQTMPIFKAIHYLEKKQKYINTVPEGRLAITDDGGTALPDVSYLKKGGKYTVTITNPWTNRRFWHEATGKTSADSAVDAERQEYVARRAGQHWLAYAQGGHFRRAHQRRKEAVIRIQSVWRGFRCRKRCREIKAVMFEFQTKSEKATCFRLAEQVLDLRQQIEAPQRQIQDENYLRYFHEYEDELRTPSSCEFPPPSLPLLSLPGCAAGGDFSPSSCEFPSPSLPLLPLPRCAPGGGFSDPFLNADEARDGVLPPGVSPDDAPKLFKQFDVDGNGTLNLAEFQAIFHELDPGWTCGYQAKVKQSMDW
eukprot:TRINITY_DN13725_c0_g1_i2.p1 TRINITY_DN13725_c0_g1~~TRINITY_DN13725_c0_g1_i2.p1  ORF type:complete len:516 (+),score=72.35 TRINITY_DN13725_c0_g1_i2:86-1633(+)